MMQFGEYSYFVEVDALCPIFVLLLHAFDGNQLTCLFINRFDNTAKGAVAKFVAEFIFLHLI